MIWYSVQNVYRIIYWRPTVIYCQLLFQLPIFYGKEPPADALEKANSGLEVLDMILKDNSWAAGHHLSIADHALCVTVELPQVRHAEVTMKLTQN